MKSDLSEKLALFIKQSTARVEIYRKEVIYSLFGGIIEDSAVDTGQLAINWRTSQGQPNLTWFPWGFGRNNDQSTRDQNRQLASSVAISELNANIGNGSQSTFLSNSSGYAWKVEFGGFSPPDTENVTSAGYSRSAPKGMIRLNLLRLPQFSKAALAKAKATP